MDARQKWGAGFLIALLALGAWEGQRAFADVSAQGGPIGAAAEGLKTFACFDSCPNVSGFGKGSFIKGMKFLAGAANTGCAIYDSTSAIAGTAAGKITQPIDEIYESTANETNLHIWSSPIQLQNGLTIHTFGAGSVCIVYY